MPNYYPHPIPPGTIEDQGKAVDIFKKGDTPGIDEPMASNFVVTSRFRNGKRIYVNVVDRSELARTDGDDDLYRRLD